MIRIEVKGKEIISTKDFLFLLLVGFTLGFSTALGIYTGSIVLSIFLICVSSALFVIYILKLVKRWGEISEDVNSSQELKIETRMVKNIKPRRFFEA